MKKRVFIILTICLMLICAITLAACGKEELVVDDPVTPTIDTLKTISGVEFNDKTVTYNGDMHTLTVSGTLPSDAKVTYTNNSGTNAGVYDATAIISASAYYKLTLNCKLTINKADITGVVFSNYTCDYDTTEHTLLARGIPDDATVTYSSNTSTDAGIYNANVLVTKANYNDLSLNATLTINKIVLPNITFPNGSFEYDQQEHSISVTVNIPAGESVIYSGGENENKAVNVGTYSIQAVVGGKNYIQQTLSATLKIKATEELLSVVKYGDTIYFQNALDGNKLYSYCDSNLEKVNNERPQYFVLSGTNLYYFNPNLLSSGIASFDGTNSNNLYDVNGEYLTTDGTYLYYAVSNLIKTSTNGIYKVAIADLENGNVDPVPSRLTSSKAEYLTYANGFIYFSNKSESGKLYRISTSVTDGVATLVYDYKVSDMIVDNNIIYFTRHFTLSNASAGAAIYSINVANSLALPITDDASQITKITYSKGKYLAKAGDFIYFVNTDLATSTLFGDGIYKAKADGTNWAGDTFSLLTGASKIVDGANDNIYSLTTDGTDIFYYRANNKHLYKYDGTNEIDLMDGFVPTAEPTVISTYYEDMEQYNGELYYINMRDGGRLYKYNIQQDEEYRITGLQVADFAINEDYVYYATVRFMTNFDLYRLHLITGELERISTDKCFHLAFDKEKIYFANFSSSNTFNSMNLDGTENTILFNAKSVDDYNIVANNGKVYFVANGIFYVWDIETSTSIILNTTAKPNEFILANGKLFLMNDKATNSFASLTLDGTTLTDISSIGFTDGARSFFTIGNDIYYYRNTALGSSNKGLYKVDMTASNPTAILVNALDDETNKYYMSSAQVINGKVYFIDVWQVQGSIPTPASTGKLCMLDLITNVVTVLAE
jgi:hypothetical protein